MIALEQKVKWQLPASLVPDKKWDVVIIGAGPAGAIAAVHLAAKNHQVLLIDKKRFPRDKVCGDGLIQDALRCLDNAGLGERIRERGHLVQIATVFSPSRIKVEVAGLFITMKRHMLDTMIARRATDVGADFIYGEVDKISLKNDQSVCFSLRDIHRNFHARVGIIATGANVRLLQRIGWQAPSTPSAVAVRCYVISSLELERMVISYDKSIAPGYAWIFPMGKHEYNVGCGILSRRAAKKSMHVKRAFEDFVREFPLARELMRRRTAATPLKGFGLRCGFEGVYPYARGPLLAIGETIGTTLPFTYEGIGKAMETGQLAAEIVHDALSSGNLRKLVEYPQRLESELKPRYRSYRIAQRWLAVPKINDFVLNRARKSNRSREIWSGILTETNDPREFFSLKGIISTFFK